MRRTLAVTLALFCLVWIPPAQPADETRELVIGSEVDYPPFAVGAADSEPNGFTVELWKAVAQETGLKYRFRVRPFAEILQEFRAGKIDVLINLAQSPQRSEFAGFSVPNVIAYGAVFARRGALSFQSEEELKHKSIIVIRADLPHDYALASGYRNLTAVADVAAGMKLLAGGQHDGMLVSRLVGQKTLKDLGLRDIEPVGPPIKGVVQKFSFAVQKHDAELLARINEGLALTRSNGQFQQIYEKWFAALDPQPPTLTEASRYLAPALALVALGFGLYVYQRRVSAQLARTAGLLRQRESTLSLAQRVAQLGNWEYNRASGALTASDEVFRIHGLVPGAEPVSRDMFLHRVHTDDRAALGANLDAALNAGRPFEQEYRLVLPDGQDRFVLHRAESVPAAAIGESRTVGTILDITHRRRAESLQFSQRRVLEMIAEGAPLGQILNALVESLENQLPGAMGGVLLVDDSGTALTNGAGAKLPASYRAGLEGLRIGPSVGSCGTACFRAEPVIVSDIATDPLWDEFRDFALAHNIRACWSHPIIGANGKVLGAFSLSHARPRTPRPGDMQLIATQAHLAALAIDRHRGEEALRRVNESLEERVAQRASQLAQANTRLEAEVLERKRIQESYVNARNFLDNIINALRDPIFVKDEAHRWVLLNDAACAFIGRPREGLIGKSDFDVFPREQAEVFWEHDDKVFAAGGEDINEESLTGTDGVEHWIQTRKSLFVEPGGKRLLVGMIRDFTERKRTEQALAKAKADAEDATRAKSLFLATMSHEVRTPMNGVIGMVDLLRETRLDADQQRMLATVRDSSCSLLRILDDILDFSKIEAGKLQLESTDISIEQIVDSVAETFTPLAAKKGVALETFVDPRIPPALVGDPVRVRQVLFNLIGNAVKFTGSDDRAGKVVVRADWLDASPGTAHDGAGLLLTVIDNGVGMTEDVRARLFQPFTQADGSTTRRFGGTGLGLSICRRLVDLMQGRIEAESARGKGSTFRAYLPLPLPPQAPAREEELIDLRGLDVLIVSNDDIRAGAAHAYADAAGAGVRVCAELKQARNEALAAAAAAAARAERVVVLDCGFPKLKRIALREAFRQDPALAPVRFVVLAESSAGAREDEFPDSVISVCHPLKRSALVRAVAVAAGRRDPDTLIDLADVPAALPAQPPPAQAENDGRLILLAEDNPTNQEVIRRQIMLLGYAVDVVSDGRQAFERYRQRRYGLLLTDCHMPDWDGYQLTAAIRDAERGRHGAGGKRNTQRLPIIAITANALQGEAERCFEAGMDDYLAKPVELRALRRALARWLPPPQTAATADNVTVNVAPATADSR